MESSPSLDVLQERLLVLRAQEGDGEAFRVLCDAYDPKLSYFLRRYTSDEHVARDLLQEVWFEMFLHLKHLRAPQAFRCWLYRIAHHRAVNRVRADRREMEVLQCVLSERDVECIDEFATVDQAEAVHVALGQLAENERIVLTLRFLEDLTIDEMADILQLPPGTVKSRLHYAKKSLERLLRNMT